MMFKTKHVATRLYFLVAMMSFGMIVMGVAGLNSMSGVVSGLKTVYEDRTVPLIELGGVDRQLNLSFAEVLRAFQHNPASELSTLHDHPVSEHLKRLDDNLAAMDSLWAQYMGSHHTPEEKELAADYEKKHANYVNELIKPVMASLRSGDYSLAVVERFLKGNRKQGKDVSDAMKKLIALQDREAKEQFEKAVAGYNSARTMSIASIAVGLVLGLFLAYWVIRSITGPLGQVRSTIAEVERDNDFTRSVDVDSEDEVGQTAGSFNQLVTALRETFRAVLDNVAKVSDAVGNVAATSNQVAASSNQQSEAAAAMASSVEQMTVSISHVSDSARDALAISRKSGELSAQGGEIIHRAVKEMSQIANTVHQASDTIGALGKQSEQVTAVVQVIKDVADQTNLLALNAAIEAARAGEQGRGFAVVADEVRKLAERTTKATGEITAMIASMQDSSRSAVTTMEDAVVRVSSGVTLAEQAGQAINEIKAGADQVVVVVNDISAALAEQSVASNDIAAHVERVAQMAEENSAAAGEAAQSAERLDKLAVEMRGAVSKFKI